MDTGSDNRNGQALLDLHKSSNVVGGSKTFNDAYATLFGQRYVVTKRQHGSSSTTQANVVKQLYYKQQQSVSGALTSTKEYGEFAALSAVLLGRMRKYCRPQMRCLMRCEYSL